MELLKKLNKEIEFKYNISEITSISADLDYEYVEGKIKGSINLDGDYISEFVDDIKEEFNYTIDFTYEIENLDKDDFTVNIEDFTYDINQNKLIVYAELLIKYSECQNEDRIEFDKFIKSKEIDIDDFLINNKQETEEIKEENETTNTNTVEDNIIIDNSINIENNILNIDDDNDYITYHIYVVSEFDTIESIATKFNIDIDLIKEYNNIDNITPGMKLIIPNND